MTLDVRNLFLPAILMELPISVECDSKYVSKRKLMITRLISTIIRMPIRAQDSAISHLLAGQRREPLHDITEYEDL